MVRNKWIIILDGNLTQSVQNTCDLLVLSPPIGGVWGWHCEVISDHKWWFNLQEVLWPATRYTCTKCRQVGFVLIIQFFFIFFHFLSYFNMKLLFWVLWMDDLTIQNTCKKCLALAITKDAKFTESATKPTTLTAPPARQRH